MSEHTRRGRHRSASRYSPVSELSSIARAAGENGARASAVLAASGGLVATFALPAQAATGSGTTAVAAAEPAAATGLAASAPRALAVAPAVVAPQAASPVAVGTVGVTGVTAVAKPKPKPKPKPEPAPEVAAPVAAAVAARDGSGTASRSEDRPAVTNVKQSSSQVVNIARGLLGIPYVYGGASPSGFDCSGFTMYVFGKAGVSLPRTAAAQQSAATPVSDPQPGDLVFFGSPAWHVGIYTGGGMMIDSGKPGEVTQERAVFSGVSGYGRF